VRHFNQILLWRLELIPSGQGEQDPAPWQRLVEDQAQTWREVGDEFPNAPALFQERHYNEFVTFLPEVQRFLYGEGASRDAGRGKSPIRVLRRTDVRRARLMYPDEPEPAVLDVAHVDLYFFFDIDVIILVVELTGDARSTTCAARHSAPSACTRGCGTRSTT